MAGETMQIYHHQDGGVRIDIPVVFLNSGSRSGVFMRAGLLIKRPSSKEGISLTWEGTKTYEKGRWEYSTFDMPISVPGDGQVEQMMNFKGGLSSGGWVPEAATYECYLLGWTSSSKQPDVRYRFEQAFTEGDVRQINLNAAQQKRNGHWVRGQRYGIGAGVLSADVLQSLL